MTRKIGKALVVGAGISGIRAALDLAEFGYGVTLIDRQPHMGGILTQLDYQFPTDRCGMCKMLPLTDRDASSQYCLRKGLFHENIDILLSTELTAVEGEPGHFNVTLQEKTRWINPELCIGCGECTKVCPVEVPDEFNAGLSKRKAVYLPVPHAIPNPYVIDMAACTRCGECEKVCPTQAIQLSLTRQEREKFRILVVDDELIVRDSLKEWLEDEGFGVDMAGSGQEALDMLAAESYRLMLLDIKMPGMDGVDVLKKAKEISDDLSVVMMTAYATVETAVEAMKIGALDYLMKPFDPDVLIPKILGIYQEIAGAKGKQLEVGAILLCGGTAYFDPRDGKNTFGYGVYPNVVTSLEFERILSGTGPACEKGQGKLVRPYDGKPIRKIAWIQCVGSRDLQLDADFCSNICCMYAIKECLVTMEKVEAQGDEPPETTIFYMDMRTFGKSFQRYRDRAESEHGVCFEKARIHSVRQDETSYDLMVRYMALSGEIRETTFDMIVLTVGQRPAPGTQEMAEMLEIPLNSWGFIQTEPFSLTRTEKPGIVAGGSFSGLKDISESVTQASAAALAGSHVIHNAGGSIAPESAQEIVYTDVSREPVRILVIICTCGKKLFQEMETDISQELKTDPAVVNVEWIDHACTAQGWETLTECIQKNAPNRVLIGACLPYVYARKIRELAKETHLNPALIEVVEILDFRFLIADFSDAAEAQIENQKSKIKNLKQGIARLRWTDPNPVPCVPIYPKALVVGGGIAGITAALSIAEHGFQVDLVEKGEQLGGNLHWLGRTVEGYDPGNLLEEMQAKIEKHPLIQFHPNTQVAGAYGSVGRFHTTLEDTDKNVQSLEHGVVILATGGTEAATTSYGYGTSDAIVTQKELEQKLADDTIEPGKLDSVVMIQCVDSREEPRNYCSRVCCISTIKHALYLKEKNPDVAIYVMYRDMMTYGFAETYYTRARKAGIIFISYNVNEKPRVTAQDNLIQVTATDPILRMEIEIEADLLVLATGIVPTLPRELAEMFGAETDSDGFFQEAESKWRPVDSLREGVFACGLAHSPRSVTETIATAEAAAQRALRILCRKELPSGKVVAKVRSSLCSQCERCIEVCPYGARVLNEDIEAVVVNPVMCQGCGSCAVVCPNGASVVEGFGMQMMMDVIDANF